MDIPKEPSEQYAIDKIVDHLDSHEGRRYRSRWYGYGADEDTYQPASNLPSNFIKRFLRSQKYALRSGKPQRGSSSAT